MKRRRLNLKERISDWKKGSVTYSPPEAKAMTSFQRRQLKRDKEHWDALARK